MVRVSPSARRTKRMGFTSSLALAIALASGSVIGAGGLATPAHAQSKPSYSKGFVKAYKPANDLFSAAADAAAAEAVRPMLDPLVAAIENDDDRLAAGQFMLNVGIKLKDTELQRQGLMLQLDSGKAPPEQLGLFNFYVGSLSWDKKDYPNVRKYLSKAFELGYYGDNTERLIGETYFEQNQFAEGLAELERMTKVRGGDMPEDTLRRALQVAYEHDLTNQVDLWSANLVRYHPSPETWNTALAVVLDSHDLTSDETVDLFRLMKRTGALKNAREYVDYIEAADARRMANEVLPLIQDAIAKGLLEAGDVFVKEALDIATTRAPEDRADAPEIANDARTAANGNSARAAGDNFLSLNSPAEAEEMYQLALEKGGVDANRVLIRLGIVQADQGKFAEARQSFAQVTGKRSPIAAMWTVYVDGKEGQ